MCPPTTRPQIETFGQRRGNTVRPPRQPRCPPPTPGGAGVTPTPAACFFPSRPKLFFFSTRGTSAEHPYPPPALLGKGTRAPQRASHTPPPEKTTDPHPTPQILGSVGCSPPFPKLFSSLFPFLFFSFSLPFSSPPPFSPPLFFFLSPPSLPTAQVLPFVCGLPGAQSGEWEWGGAWGGPGRQRCPRACHASAFIPAAGAWGGGNSAHRNAAPITQCIQGLVRFGSVGGDSVSPPPAPRLLERGAGRSDHPPPKSTPPPSQSGPAQSNFLLPSELAFSVSARTMRG